MIKEAAILVQDYSLLVYWFIGLFGLFGLL
jgi:hypothetical protein